MWTDGNLVNASSRRVFWLHIWFGTWGISQVHHFLESSHVDISARVRTPCWMSQFLISLIASFLLKGDCPIMMSCQSIMFFPLLGMWYKCFWKNSIPWRQRWHIDVPMMLLFTCKFLSDEPFRYFFFMTWLTGCLLFEKRVQSILLPRARLARPGSLICRPPSKMGLLTLSQFTRWNFLWFPLPPLHRKSLIILEIYSVIFFGARRKEAW